MRKLILFCCIFLFSFSILKAENPRIENAIPTGFLSAMNPDFGNDIIVANTNPIGPMSGVRSPDGTIYVAINDTTLTSNLGLVILQSSNSGTSWSLFLTGISIRAKYSKVKMLTTSDSVYCFFMQGTTITRWNPLNSTIKTLDVAPAKDFDVAFSSTSSMYVYFQTSGDTLRRIASIDRGLSWINGGLISGSGGSPRMSFSTTGDSLLLNYRGPYRAEAPEKSIWRSALYRQLSPGTIGFVSSSFVDILTDTSVVHSEIKSIRHGPLVWTVYTEGITGSLDLKCMTSMNGGTVYGTPFSISSSTTRDEYWFDIGASTAAVFPGVDLIYYSDSLQADNPTNASDKMMYTSSTSEGPGIFIPPIQFSEVPPVFSTSGCKPSLAEMTGNDFGVFFLAYTTGGNKVYWDRFTAVTNVNQNGNSIAEKYELKQNYPNPFNPTTNIAFNVPKNSFVNLKVFDITGKEVARLVSENMNAGNYSVQFDGSKLSSGVYFYRLEGDNFSDVKKMSLIK